MNRLLGRVAFWRHLDGNGKQARDLSGEIMAIQRAGSPSVWSVLLCKTDGTLEACDPEDLCLDHPPAPIAEPAETVADVEGGREAIAALDRIETYLEQNFADTNHGGGPVEWATSLLGQLRVELLELGEERDGLKALLAKATAKKARTSAPPEGA